MATALRSRQARVDLLDNGNMEFQSPWLAGNVYLLAPISFGSFEFQSIGPREVVVRYRVSLRRVLVGLLIFHISLVFFLANGPPPITIGPHWLNVFLSFLGLSALVWVWVYGVGRLIVSVRFYMFVENVCRKARQTGHRVPDATKRASR